MAAGIAGVIVGGTMLLAVISLFFVGKPEDFGRAKDILLFINPFLGVVIGFYFNKVSSEARAENAESNARVATATAQQASQERTVATVEAERAKADAQQAQATTQQVQATNQELSTTLNDVTLAASDVLQQAPAKLAPVPGTLGGGGDNAQANAEWEAKRRRLEEALGRARRMPR
jgi:ABC-type multidrug transport system fused ATPase/permease subunit